VPDVDSPWDWPWIDHSGNPIKVPDLEDAPPTAHDPMLIATLMSAADGNVKDAFRLADEIEKEIEDRKFIAKGIEISSEASEVLWALREMDEPVSLESVFAHVRDFIGSATRDSIERSLESLRMCGIIARTDTNSWELKRKDVSGVRMDGNGYVYAARVAEKSKEAAP
jgi:hypothetical protein